MTDPTSTGVTETAAATEVAAAAVPTDLVLTPPEPVAAVSPGQTKSLVPIDAATTAKLDAMVAAYGDTIVSLDIHTTAFTDKVTAVENLGDKEIRESASVSNRMLDRPVNAMGKGVFDKTSRVASSLTDLRKTVNDLDPSKHDIMGERKLLGMIPFGSRIKQYFEKYQSAQTHINSIIQSLYNGQDELQKDNASIEQEKVNLWTSMQRLQQYAYMAAKIDVFLEAKVASMQVTDPDRAKVLNEDVLFYVRQKRQDLMTQLAVSAQGYLALDLVRKNNVELIKGVDRATSTTVAALRTAVIVAQALANEKLVLDQITAVNVTTGNLIESTSVLLKQQTEQVHAEAASAMVNIEQLKAAFDNIYSTIDSIDTYKVAALETMKTTVDSLQVQVTKAQSYLDRAHAEPVPDPKANAGGSELNLPTASGQ